MIDERWTHLEHADVEAWAELTNLLARHDQTEEFYDAEDLTEELTEHGFEPRRDSWAVHRGDQLVAFGQLRVAMNPDAEGRVRCNLTGGVHPDHRGTGIGRALLDKMEARADGLAAERHPGREHFYRVSGGCRAEDPVRQLLEHRGYAVIRWFDELERAVPGEPFDVALPEGVELVRPTEALREPVRLAHNRAFADHWGSTPSAPESWGDLWSARSSRLPLSTVALAAGTAGSPQAQVLGYVLCGQWVERELYVSLVGTVPEARGRGIARACLAETVRAAAADGGFDLVELGVDSASLTGAGALYASLGFARVRQSATYQRPA